MYKDFKKSETLDTGFTSGNSLIWMFSGIVVGLLVGLGMYFFTNDKMPKVSMIDSLEEKIQKVQTKSSETKNQSTVQKDSEKAPVAEEKRTNKFSYYAVLPNLDVPVDSAKPINTSANGDVNANIQNSEAELELVDQYNEAVAKQNEMNDELEQLEAKPTIGDYLLQVASFKKESMADKTRGRLNNKGINAYIQKKKIKGRLWYRVVAGPVDQVNINSWKHTAEKLGHKPLVISIR